MVNFRSASLNHDKSFIYEARGFDNIDDMNATIIMRLIEDINKEDTLYILGDVMLGNRDEEAIELVKMIPGHKHLIIGNHDTPRRLQLYKDNNLFESMQYALPLVTKKWHFFMSHYPMLTFNNDTRPDVVSLYAHTHQVENWFETEYEWQTSAMYNVGVDAHKCHPVSLDEIIDDIRKKIQKEKEFVMYV